MERRLADLMYACTDYLIASAQAICYAASDVKEGVAAIKEKRKPVFNK
jgi:hypothetical protein